MRYFRIEGVRPGSPIHTPFGYVKPNADGVARLSDGQFENLTKREYVLTEVEPPANETEERRGNWEAEIRHRKEVEAALNAESLKSEDDAKRRSGAQSQVAEATAAEALKTPPKSEASGGRK